jgi:hypothetical protein
LARDPSKILPIPHPTVTDYIKYDLNRRRAQIALPMQQKEEINDHDWRKYAEITVHYLPN